MLATLFHRLAASEIVVLTTVVVGICVGYATVNRNINAPANRRIWRAFRMALQGFLLLAFLVSAVVPARAATAANSVAPIVKTGPADAIGAWDERLCITAQRLIAGRPELRVEVLRGGGNGFHTIQMDTDAARRVAVVAAAQTRAELNGVRQVVSVACKMVNAERVADVLGLSPIQPPLSCADVNRHTYDFVLSQLSPEARERYLEEGVQLRFAADVVMASGGEWLPAAVDRYIDVQRSPEGKIEQLLIRAPSVQVPWDSAGQEFFQGTRHCKLISAAAMRHWMLAGAFADTGQLLPPMKQPCYAPSAEHSAAGSCLFWFAPAGTMFCKDYTGSAWNPATARAECGKRHASAAALAAADNRYEGAGGVYSEQGCTARADAAPLGGTCVFNCNAPDESLWRLSGSTPERAAGPMTRACDLFIP